MVSPLIKNGSSLEEKQKDLVKRLYDNSMKQETVDILVSDINQNGGKWTVTTKETINLTYSSGNEETKD